MKLTATVCTYLTVHSPEVYTGIAISDTVNEVQCIIGSNGDPIPRRALKTYTLQPNNGCLVVNDTRGRENC